MGINLMALLQSAGALPTPNSPEINVIGKKKVPAVPEPTPVEPTAQDVSKPAAEPAKRRMLSDQQLMNRQGVGNLPEHKGMFGVKGTLRDILGALGDNYLMQSGQKPRYQEMRKQEKASDAMAEMTTSPINAIQALLGAGETDKAFELYKQFQAQGNKDAELDIQRGSAASTQSNAKSKQIETFLTRAGQMLNGTESNPAKRMAVLGLLGKQAAAIGIDQEALGISDRLTEEEAAAFTAGATTVNQQNNLPLAQKRVGIAQQNADSATKNAESQRINANRTRPGPQRGATNVDAEILDNVRKGTATPAEQKIYKERLAHSKKGSVLSDMLGAPPGSSGSKPKYQENQVLIQNGHRFIVKGGKPVPQ